VYKDLEKCSFCGLDRFNHRKDGNDDENYNRRKGGHKRYFDTFLPFLISSAGLQIKRIQNCCDGTKRSISRMLE
jgi:hypothetical protein